MKSSLSLLLLLILGAFSTRTTAQTLPLKAGLYEITTELTVRGKPIAPEKKTRCIKSEQLTSVEAVFNVRPMAGFCAVSNLKIGAGKISYQAECPNSSVTVEGTVKDDAYSVVRKHKPKVANGAETVTKFQGKWMAPCH